MSVETFTEVVTGSANDDEIIAKMKKHLETDG
jgi:hypothetical protein